MAIKKAELMALVVYLYAVQALFGFDLDTVESLLGVAISVLDFDSLLKVGVGLCHAGHDNPVFMEFSAFD